MQGRCDPIMTDGSFLHVAEEKIQKYLANQVVCKRYLLCEYEREGATVTSFQVHTQPTKYASCCTTYKIRNRRTRKLRPDKQVKSSVRCTTYSARHKRPHLKLYCKIAFLQGRQRFCSDGGRG